MLAEANVTVVTQLVGLASAVKDGLVLKSVTTESGATLTGSIWVDGTYGGDLGYIAGAAMVWGRESVTQYNNFGVVLDHRFGTMSTPLIIPTLPPLRAPCVIL